MGLGAWSFLEEFPDTDIKKFESVADIFIHVSLALIMLGMVIFWMSFAGCLGALRENLCFLKMVSIILTKSYSSFALLTANLLGPHELRLSLINETLSL